MNLDFSEFHPLDHRIGSRRCRHVEGFPEAPQGWGNVILHARYWHLYKSPWATRRVLRLFRDGKLKNRKER